MKRYALCLLAMVVMSACGGSSTTTPTPAVSPSTATIAVEGLTVSVQSGTSGLTYLVSFKLHETGGRVAASVTAFTFALADGRSSQATGAAVSVAAGATVSAGPFDVTDNSGAAATSQMTVTVAYGDATGRSTTVSATAAVAAPPAVTRITLAGVVTDAATGKPIGGAFVTATDSRGTQTLGSTDGNGYYSISGVLAGSVTVRLTATGYAAASRTVTATTDTRVDLSATASGPPPAIVEYRVTGTRAFLTYATQSGGTAQEKVDLPWSYTWSSARSGDFLYISAQNDLPSGSVTVQIYKNGSLYKTTTSSGAYVIATASGSY